MNEEEKLKKAFMAGWDMCLLKWIENRNYGWSECLRKGEAFENPTEGQEQAFQQFLKGKNNSLKEKQKYESCRLAPGYDFMI